MCLFDAAPARARRQRTPAVNELARNAAQQFAAARADVEQTRPAVAVGDAGPERRADARRGHGARARTQPRHRRRTAESADCRTTTWPGCAPPTGRLLTSVIGHRAVVQPPTNQLNGGNIVQNDTSTYNAGITQALPWGGGNFAFQFNNNKQVTSNLFANFNPTLTRQLRGDLHAAAAARLHDRRHPAAAAGHRDQPRHLRDPGAQHAGARPSPTCATRIGSCCSRCRRWTSRAARWTWPRSWWRTTAPGSRSAPWRRSTSCSPRPRPPRAGRRWRRPRRRWAPRELALKRLIVSGTDDPLWRSDDHADRSARVPARAARRRRRGRARRSTAAPISSRRARPSTATTSPSSSCSNQTLPAVDLVGQLRRAGARRHAVHPRGRPRQHRSSAPFPGGYSDALEHADRPQTTRPGTCR